MFEGMSRLIIISNRLPFSIEKTEGQTQLRQSSGGLVSALKSFFDQSGQQASKYAEKLWVGSADFAKADWEETAKPGPEDAIQIEPIFIDDAIYSDYYNGFSNSVIWPLFHYFPSIVDYKKEYFEAYTRVNTIFAEHLQTVLREDDTIWIHDYQLMLLPAMLREARPAASIGFFLHIPFPSYEIFRLLPGTWKKALVKGVLGADLVGFHTHDYAQHFIQSARMLLGVDNQFNKIRYNNHLVKVDLFPIGIDYEKFASASKNPEVLALRADIRHRHEGQQIIFSVDRLDYSKGLMYRLNGYQEFLQTYPEWKEKVVFILSMIPSRDAIPTYIERKREIEEKISAVNGKYSTLHWQPIIYRYNHLPFDHLSALYQAADVALITPLRDGMNLVAKEYVATTNGHPGVLILSELTGAASELNEAILVNPTDTSEVAAAIYQALNMDEAEKKNRMHLMQRRLKDYDVVRWVTDFLEQLTLIKQEQQKLSSKVLNAPMIAEIRKKYCAAFKRMILLDYDGTLSPFMKVPSEARPSAELMRILTEMTMDSANDVCVISGRDADTLDKWLGHLPLILVAEHGAFIKQRSGLWQQQSSVLPDWKDQIRPILQLFVTRCAGSFIEEKRNTLVWHYRNTHPDLGFIRSRELINNLQQLTVNSNLQVIDGNKVLEVRLTGLDKGITSLKLINASQPDFILCLGDDTTDEDMFRVLENRATTIKIGFGPTAAQYNLRTQQEVLPLLAGFLTQKTVEGISQ
jgi:trehalose 6-phosphate synthase/phosphatase